MTAQPTLETQRLLLRPFTLEDAPRVQLLAGDERIADVTANIPHPYRDGMAAAWIASHAEKWRERELAAFAMVNKTSGLLVGCISLMHMQANEAEIGYWVGVDYWNRGYGTEACRAVVAFAFGRLSLTRVYAHHLSRNPASGKVLLKAGLRHTGTGTAPCGYRNLEERVEQYECCSA